MLTFCELILLFGSPLVRETSVASRKYAAQWSESSVGTDASFGKRLCKESAGQDTRPGPVSPGYRGLRMRFWEPRMDCMRSKPP